MTEHFDNQKSKIKLVVFFNDRKNQNGFSEREVYYNYSNTNRRDVENIINGMASRILTEKLRNRYSTALFYENKQGGELLRKLRGTL